MLQLYRELPPLQTTQEGCKCITLPAVANKTEREHSK